MKMLSTTSFIFALRTFIAAMLALYISYSLDLSRPTWAFVTAYIVSAPLLGMGRSKGLYRMCGTIAGAVFSVLAVPNLVNAPELMVLAISFWISGCLYLSLVDGTPRSYAFMLAGYTAALIGFPSVSAPQLVFDTALSRTEEIGVAIFCVQLMSYLPFNQTAGAELNNRIDKWLMDARLWAIDLMKFSKEETLVADRSRLMIDAMNLDALRIHAHYDTPRFGEIEGWIIDLQRHLQDFFADLVTLEAQINTLKKNETETLLLLHPYFDAILSWIDTKEAAIPETLHNMLIHDARKPEMAALVKSGAIDTITDLIRRRSESMDLRAKIHAGVKHDRIHASVSRHVDHRQAAIYCMSVAGILIAMSTFWILTQWPDGGTAAMLATVICCFFASLEAPPKAAFMFLVMSCVGSFLGWGYNFIIFPHIDGFPLLVYTLALSCIPVGMLMANPALTGIMLPVIIGINLASFQNRFDADITTFFNGFIAQTIGVLVAGTTLNFIRAISIQGATDRLLTQNGQSLAELAKHNIRDDSFIIDRMAHRAGMAFIRASGLKDRRDKVITRILLDLQAGRALVQIKALMPRMPDDLQQAVRLIQDQIASYFAVRHGLQDSATSVCGDIRALTGKMESSTMSFEAMRLNGLLKTLSRGLGKETTENV